MSAPLRIQVKVLPGNEDLPLPRYMTERAAGMDLCAAVEEPLVLSPGERIMVPTGFRMALPEGYEAEIRPRSGLAIQHGITLINAPGTIDADYRGEVRILMINLGQEPYVLRRGDRVAQMVVHQVCRAELELAEDLEDTKRAAGGFGHTGA